MSACLLLFDCNRHSQSPQIDSPSACRTALSTRAARVPHPRPLYSARRLIDFLPAGVTTCLELPFSPALIASLHRSSSPLSRISNHVSIIRSLKDRDRGFDGTSYACNEDALARVVYDFEARHELDMAMLASKSPYPAPSLGGGSSQPSTQYSGSSMSTYRSHATAARTEQPFFASPTESEFSELYDAPDSIRHWDEDKVGDWLKRINCPQYVELFKSMFTSFALFFFGPLLTNAENHINGENLMEMDQTHLKEMGIKKVGDRVRIGSQAKQLRNKEYKKASKRTSNRVS